MPCVCILYVPTTSLCPMWAFAVNDTDIDCPVDDDDEEVCGNDGKTYSSVCRMLIESDDVYAIYDGPCNRTECEDAPVSG